MDFHAAMETFAEAWVAANTPTAVNASEVRHSLYTISINPTDFSMDCYIRNIMNFIHNFGVSLMIEVDILLKNK